MTENTEKVDKTFDDELFDIILDPVRSKILSLTHLYGNITQSQIEGKLKISRSTISHHLKKLVEKDLLLVNVSPIGYPVKKYSLSHNLNFKLDRKKIKEMPIGLSSSHLINYLMSIALNHQSFGNSAIESVKILQESAPFQHIVEDEQKNLIIKTNDANVFIPPLVMMYTGEEQAKYIKEKLFSLLEDIRIKFLPKELDNSNQRNHQISYLVNLAIFPFPREFVQSKDEEA